MKFILYFLDYFFIIFHTSLIIFNCFGWIFKKTRLLNLITLSITAFSWFILGIWYGFGFCFCTECHWKVRELIGYKNPYYSYIQFLLNLLFKFDLDSFLVDRVTLIVFIISYILSIIMNINDLRRKKIKL